MTVSTISVSDMRCGGCAGKIERALTGVAGITGTRVNPARRLVLVEHESDVDPVALLQHIEDAGFHPSLARIDAGTPRQRDLLKRLGIAGLAMMQVMMFALALYAGAFAGMEAAHRRLLELASLAFCLPVVTYSAVPFFRNALAAVGGVVTGRGRLDMDVPIALAIGTAFTVSLANTLRGTGEVYYDSVVMFTFLLLAARYVDDRLKARFENANRALAALPEQATVLRADGTACRQRLAAIVPGSTVWVNQGEQVPLDGTVARGAAVVDESALTGESVWVRRRAGEAVFGGTCNRGAGFAIRTTAAPDGTRLARIAALADRAQADKPRIARLADRIAGRFVPAVLLLAAATWLGWQLVDPARALVAALTVLVVSCPCALSLATPAAITAAMTRLRQSGIVLTRSDALEQAAAVDAALLDKTGTLTVADPVIDREHWAAGAERSRLAQAAAALELHADHPLARAFRRAYPDARADRVSDVEVVPGAGVQGRLGPLHLRLGRADFCGAAEPSGPDPTADERRVHLAVDGVPVAWFDVADPLRPGAPEAVAELCRAGLDVTMLSGDAPDRCRALARELGIGFAARQAPETKLEVLRGLQARGRKVLVLGDGINDVPVLAAADVGAAVVESSDLVKANADVLLLCRRLGSLPELVHVARRARRIVRQNLAWALAYNLTAMPLAALGLVPPWAAAVGMAASSILVMTNAARLLDRRTRPRAEATPRGSPIAEPAT